jgi:mannose-6-phosphate isomerase/cell division protein ZapA
METGVLHFKDVLGSTFSITANKNSAYLEDLLIRYRAVLDNTRKIAGVSASEPIKLAILSGFLLCDEIEEMKKQRAVEDNESIEAEQRILDIIARIDEIIPCE